MPDEAELNRSRLSRKWDVLIRRITADRRVLPDFVGIGIQKAGTTSLFSYLIQHPQIIPALKKEIGFFDLKYHRGLRWYRSHFPTRNEMARTARQLGKPVVTGETSPYYCFHPLGIQRLYQHVPQAKLILMMRNPVDRAFSHYNYSVKRGEEDLSFIEALDAEETRLAGERQRLIDEPEYKSFTYQFQSYQNRGKYIEQIRRIHEFFPREQLYVQTSERFFADPQKICDEIAGFLGLAPSPIPDLRPRNVTPHPDLKPEWRTRLQNYYADYNQQLVDYLGFDPGWS